MLQSIKICRRIIQELSEKMGEPMEQDDAEKRRSDRDRRKKERRATCTCGSRSNKKRQRILSQNPFIIFYLEMYFKSSGKHVTEVAREAGKAWCAMSEEERKKYILLAEKVRLQRRGKLGERKRQSIC